MNARATLAAAGTGAGRAMLLVAYAGFVAIAALAAANLPGGRPGNEVLLILLIPTALLWAGWFARLLLLQREAARDRLPGAARAVGGALAIAVACSVVLPAAVVGALGVAPVVALAGFAIAAACGLSFMLLPRGVASFTGLLPMAARATGLDRLLGTLDPGWLVPSAAVALAGLCAWRWVRLLHAAEVSQSAWAQPLLFLSGERGSFWNTRALDEIPAGTDRPRWLRPGVQAAVGPTRPVVAMRTLLGSPFAPAPRRLLAMHLVLWAALAAMLWRWLLTFGHRSPSELLAQGQALALLSGGAVVVATYAMRLQQLRARAGGTLAELALLPGWGDADRARRTLLAAVGGPVAAACGLLLAVVVALAIVAHDGALLAAMLLLAVCSVALAGAALCLRALLGRQLEAGGKWAMVLCGMLLFALTSAAFERGANWQLAGAVAWLALAAGALAALVPAWRELRARPHPFLLD